VASRLHLLPGTDGTVRWLDGRRLVYEHQTLRTNTSYEVILEPGYRDLAGNTYMLRHHWSFVTEGPPRITASTPVNGDTGIDPAAYLSLDFSRAMDATTLRGAISITPAIPFDIRLDPADSKRAILAPSQLLATNTTYEVLVNVNAADLNGNALSRAQAISFKTGEVQPLRHWITFVTQRADGSAGGLWIVNESGFPRQLFSATPVRSFNWSPAGDSILVHAQDGSWRQVTPGTGDAVLGFKGSWAAALATGLGFVYLDETNILHRLRPDGTNDVVASDVREAAVAPNGLRIAFIHDRASSNEIWAYDVGLRSSYQLVDDTAPVSSVAWDPTGKRIAYLRHDLSTTTLRMRSLTGAGAMTTLVSGDLDRPSWLPDSTHLVFSATVSAQGTSLTKAFVINVVSPPASLSANAGLPVDPSIQVVAPVASPDGHQVAFLSGGQVWLMNADGTRPTALTKQDPESFPYSCRALAWTRV
jgi:Tol biopolymer transport system component